MSEKTTLPQKVVHEVKSEIRTQLASYLIAGAAPFILTGGALLLGVLEGFPWMYVLVAASVVFAAICVGVSYLRHIAYTRSPKAKLRFGALNFAISTEMEKTSKGKEHGKPFVSGVRLSVSLTNAAIFPMVVHIEKVTTRLDGKFAIDKDGKPIENKPIDLTIDSGGIGWVNDVIVPVDHNKSIKGFELLEGDFEYSLKYGKSAGKCNYPLSGKFTIHVYLNPRPQLPIFEWHNK